MQNTHDHNYFTLKLFRPAATRIWNRNTGIWICDRGLTAHSEEGKFLHVAIKKLYLPGCQGCYPSHRNIPFILHCVVSITRGFESACQSLKFISKQTWRCLALSAMGKRKGWTVCSSLEDEWRHRFSGRTGKFEAASQRQRTKKFCLVSNYNWIWLDRDKVENRWSFPSIFCSLLYLLFAKCLVCWIHFDCRSYQASIAVFARCLNLQFAILMWAVNG